MKAPLFLLLGLASLASVSADDRRDFRREEPRVIVFEHAGFQGDSIVLYPGDSIENLSGKTFEHGAKLNDSISSIVVEGGAEVYVYENARYRGQALRVTATENREMRMQEAERKAASLPAKLTVPMIIFFLPCLFIVILGPAIIQIRSAMH